MVKKRDNTHIRFDRAHAPGPKLTSGLCLYIGLLVAPATNTVKVISNEVGLRLLCCGMCFTYIHTSYIYLRRPTTISKLFQKALLNNMST